MISYPSPGPAPPYASWNPSGHLFPENRYDPAQHLWGGDKSDVMNHRGFQTPGRLGQGRVGRKGRRKETERDLCPRARLSCLGEALLEAEKEKAVRNTNLFAFLRLGWVSQWNYFGNLNESGPLRVFIYAEVMV